MPFFVKVMSPKGTLVRVSLILSLAIRVLQRVRV